jgi:hypothetical protein
LRVSRPLLGLHLHRDLNPTDQSVGYYHSSASPTFEAKPPSGRRQGTTRNENSYPLLSIFSLRDDYRMNDPARKASDPDKRWYLRGGVSKTK